MTEQSELIVHNGRITTLANDGTPPEVDALLISGGRVRYAGDTASARELAGRGARVLDAGGRRIVPGLIDAHCHVVRAGRTWNDEIRWEDTTDLAGALGQIAAATRTRPRGQWLTVVGGWHPDQFAERRGPTRAELDQVAPDHPVLVQCMYSWGMLNSAGIHMVDLDRAVADGVDPGDVDTGDDGRPTGVVRGMAALRWLYWQLPEPPPEQQVASTIAASQALSRCGLTGVIDGGGTNTGPDAYHALYAAWRSRQLTLRVRTTVHASRPGAELSEIGGYLRYLAPGLGDDMLRVLGIGEVVHYAIHDGFHRAPDLSEATLDEVFGIFLDCARRGWTVQLHAIRPDTIDTALDLWERVAKEVDISRLRWALVHGEGLTAATVQRMAALQVGVLVPALLRFEGADLVAAWGAERAAAAPPLGTLADAGVRVGGGTDAMRVASYNPFTALHWYVTGRTVGGDQLRSAEHLLSRDDALRLYTEQAAWFSFEEDCRGRLQPGMLADLVVLDRDYFTVAADEITATQADLTLVGGEPTWCSPAFDGAFAHHT
ncbi:amidohydrolase [Phytoactinopolyspora limicola]|uniref:amidohydrolase n=1 Tax=Phytoactinopolyspora limicola TaxID=2715536 RepID=UPI00140A24D9|nr:amidohydrolase [Phytoactinopolyspora limicola]